MNAVTRVDELACTTLKGLIKMDLTGYVIKTDRGYHLNPVEYFISQMICGIENGNDFVEEVFHD